MHNYFNIPRYFPKGVKREIEEMFAASAIGGLALSMVMLFEPIFLYSVLGFTVQQVLWFMAAVYAFYIVLIPLGGKVASYYGYEHSIFLSTFAQIIYWTLLFFSQDYFGLIYIAPLFFALQKTLFWPAFHASMSRFADNGQRGREFSFLYGIIQLVYIVGPYLGGWLSERFGLRATFVIGSIIYFCSFIPLFTTKEVFTPKLYKFRDTFEMYKNFPRRALGYAGFAEDLLVLTIWPIFVFTVVKNFQGTGLLATVATLVATILALYIGKVSDVYSKKLLVKVGAVFAALAWLTRIPIASISGAFISDTLSRTSKDVVFIPLSALTYERAASTHILPYVIFFEQSLSIGKLVACLLGILVFTLTGGSFVALFLLAAAFSLLYVLI